MQAIQSRQGAEQYNDDDLREEAEALRAGLRRLSQNTEVDSQRIQAAYYIGSINRLVPALSSSPKNRVELQQILAAIKEKFGDFLSQK